MKHTQEMKDALQNLVWDLMEECGCCSSYHPRDWHGDCRDDRYRFHPDDLLACWLAAPKLLKVCKKIGINGVSLKVWHEINQAVDKAEGK